MKKTLRKAGIIATAAVTGLAPLAAPVVTFAAEDTKKPDTLEEAQKELDAAKKAEADAKKAYEDQKAVAEASSAAWKDALFNHLMPAQEAMEAVRDIWYEAMDACDAAQTAQEEKAAAVEECRIALEEAEEALEAAREEAADAEAKIEAAEKKVAEAQSKYDAAKEEAEKAVKTAEERKAQYEEAQKAYEEAEAVMEKAKACVEAAEAGKDFTDLSGHTHHFEEKEVLVEEEKGHFNTVVDKEAWDEPVYETQKRWVCYVCHHVFDKDVTQEEVAEHEDKHLDAGEPGGYGTELVQILVDTIHHEAETHEEWVVDQEAKYETVKKCAGCGKTVAEVLADAEAEFKAAEDEARTAGEEVARLTNVTGELERIAEEAVKAEKEALDALNAAKAELEEVKPADLAEAEKAYEEAKANLAKAEAELAEAEEAYEKAALAYEKAEEDYQAKYAEYEKVCEQYDHFQPDQFKAYELLAQKENAYKEAKARLVLAQTNYDELKKAEAGEEDGKEDGKDNESKDESKGNGSKGEAKNETSDTVKTGDAAPLAGLLGTMLASGSAVVTLGRKKRK